MQVRNPFDAQALKVARKRKGWTQLKVAFLLGIDTPSVCKWERGTRKPTLETRLKLAQILDAPELVNGFALSGDTHVSH